MKTIYKYKLSIGENKLKLPYVKIIGVINQTNFIGENMPVLYAIVDTDILDKELEVLVVGTGWELENNILQGTLLGTVTDGAFVWHVFYKEKSKI